VLRDPRRRAGSGRRSKGDRDHVGSSPPSSRRGRLYAARVFFSHPSTADTGRSLFVAVAGSDFHRARRGREGTTPACLSGRVSLAHHIPVAPYRKTRFLFSPKNPHRRAGGLPPQRKWICAQTGIFGVRNESDRSPPNRQGIATVAHLSRPSLDSMRTAAPSRAYSARAHFFLLGRRTTETATTKSRQNEKHGGEVVFGVYFFIFFACVGWDFF
jgi:hypothetical protein